MKSSFTALSACLLLHHWNIFYVGSANILGSVLVGDLCMMNTECVQGADCIMGTCRCNANHIAIESYCWKKETGCFYDAQCNSSWPGATCEHSTCKCPRPLQAARTREGTVCHPKGECPTNGQNSLLYNRDTNIPSTCMLLSANSWEFVGCDDFPEVYNCIDGLCCPTKALTCIQPLNYGDQGPSSFPTSRWYYDSITSSCQTFPFRGAGGNSNNFPSRELCESYCLTGQPKMLALTKTSSEVAEQSGYDCTVIGGLYQCCPSANFVCSEFGGLKTESADYDSVDELLPYASGSQRAGHQPTTRWYWNRTKNDCLPFLFLGQGGNFNNFLSKEHCEQFCSIDLCPIGSPLLHASGSPATCSTSSDCPFPYMCQSNRCCPSRDSVCSQPLAVGISCRAASLPRFWYNVTTGSCQMFMYKGCQGNSNNFLALRKCQHACEGTEVEPKCRHGVALRNEDGKLHRCDDRVGFECPANYECTRQAGVSGCCPIPEYVCSLPMQSGRKCGQNVALRWYFDETTNLCRSFHFEGCDGNMNNFPTKESCEEYCPKIGMFCPFGGDYHRGADGQPLACEKSEQCPSRYECMTLTHAEGSTNFCCPSRLSICLQTKDEGSACGQPSRRYYFDAITQHCKPMMFLGCGGNSNSFSTIDACQNFCASSACAPYETILQLPNCGIPFDCSRASCPLGYSCVKNVWNPKTMVCCGTPDSGVCPDGLHQLSDPRTLLPTPCRGNRHDVCPHSFHCLLHPLKKRHFCCGPKEQKIDLCPIGSRLIRLGSGDPMGCNAQARCPVGADCHGSGSAHSGICCKNLLNVCPPGFILDRSYQSDCSPLDQHHCSSSESLCIFTEVLQRFVCCKKEHRLLNAQPPESLVSSLKMHRARHNAKVILL